MNDEIYFVVQRAEYDCDWRDLTYHSSLNDAQVNFKKCVDDDLSANAYLLRSIVEKSYRVIKRTDEVI